MRIRKKLFRIIIIVAAFVALPLGASGQSSSINTFSPYSFFGLGDLSTQGSVAVRGMGGAGVAIRDFTAINTLNPAAYSAISRRSALFSVGMEGQSYYLKDANASSSYYSFNIREIAVQFPFGQGIGFAFSITPYSNVGYRVAGSDLQGEPGSGIDYISRLYAGSGGLNQYKAGIGWELWKGKLSLGVEAVYYQGNINREYTLTVTPMTGTGTFANIYGSDTDQIHTVFMNAGLQAFLVNTPTHLLSLGAVYRMGGNMQGKRISYVPHYPEGLGNISSAVSAVRNETSTLNLTMPHTAIVGLYFSKPKYTIAADYTFASWGSSNKNNSTGQYSFRNTHAAAAGVEFTPNAIDARNYLKRCTYRIGVRYSDYYMRISGHDINEAAVTLGVGFPLDPRRRNSIDLGIEAGMRGTTRNGLIKENYIKFSLGFKFFGDDYWFQKIKYN